MAAGAALIIDQIAKAFLIPSEPVEVIRNFLQIKSVNNTGMAFGMLKGQNTMLIFLTLAFLGIIIYYSDDISFDKLSAVFTGLIIGGAFGNLIDRVCFGFVRDFIAFSFWPAFNVADMCLTIGALGIAAMLLRKKK